MVFSMVSAMAEFERSVISEWTKAGMAAARRRGRHVGRPPKLAPEQINYARRIIVKGEGRAQVARSLGVDPVTLRRAGSRPFAQAACMTPVRQCIKLLPIAR
jgi:DNA invertase Pin-like site-specific DNA recombinase